MYNLDFGNFSCAVNFGKTVTQITMLSWLCTEINSHIGLATLNLIFFIYSRVMGCIENVRCLIIKTNKMSSINVYYYKTSIDF
jgi:hypothetical protein